MADESSLAERIDAEFEAARKRSVAIQNQGQNAAEERAQRLEQVDQTLSEIRDIWRDRLGQLAKWFGDQVKVQAQIAVGSRLATFCIRSPKADFELRFAALTDDDVRRLIFQYDLSIVPAELAYDAHSELTFPIDAIDRPKLVDWFYDRIISFGKTYIAVHENRDS